MLLVAVPVVWVVVIEVPVEDVCVLVVALILVRVGVIEVPVREVRVAVTVLCVIVRVVPVVEDSVGTVELCVSVSVVSVEEMNSVAEVDEMVDNPEDCVVVEVAVVLESETEVSACKTL
jgi:hypothetical protein